MKRKKDKKKKGNEQTRDIIRMCENQTPPKNATGMRQQIKKNK